MSSNQKTIANRANSKKSTGPCTAEGKRASAGNALKHGLFAKNTPILEDEQTAFLEFADKIQADLQPQGPTETFYVHHLIDQCWRLRHCLRIETDLYEWYRVYQEAKGGIGIAFAHDASQVNCFGRLSRYAPLFERRLAKDLAELRKLQARRSRPAALAQNQGRPAALDSGAASSPVVNATTAEGAVAADQPEAAPPPQPTSDPPAASLPSGAFSDQVVLSDEDPTQFRAHVNSLLAEWQPRGATKAFFVELFAVTSWRLARLSRVEAGLYEQYRFHQNVDGGLLTAFVQDAAEVDCFAKLAQYETQLRNSLSRLLQELLR